MTQAKYVRLLEAMALSEDESVDLTYIRTFPTPVQLHFRPFQPVKRPGFFASPLELQAEDSASLGRSIELRISYFGPLKWLRICLRSQLVTCYILTLQKWIQIVVCYVFLEYHIGSQFNKMLKIRILICL